MTTPTFDLARGWQPIETAPKDGSQVIVIDMTAEEPEAGSAWFVFDFWTAVDPEGIEGNRTLLEALSWVSPTHWMPLPAPPEPGS